MLGVVWLFYFSSTLEWTIRPAQWIIGICEYSLEGAI